MLRSMRSGARRALELREDVLANVSGLGSADCRTTIDPEGEVGLKDDLDEVCAIRPAQC